MKKGRAHTLMTGGKGGAGVIVRREDGTLTIRYFTPSEAYRLQGFPGWAADRVKAIGQSDEDMWFEAGNSLGVPVMRAIFHAIDDYEVANAPVLSRGRSRRSA